MRLRRPVTRASTTWPQRGALSWRLTTWTACTAVADARGSPGGRSPLRQQGLCCVRRSMPRGHSALPHANGTWRRQCEIVVNCECSTACAPQVYLCPVFTPFGAEATLQRSSRSSGSAIQCCGQTTRSQTSVQKRMLRTWCVSTRPEFGVSTARVGGWGRCTMQGQEAS